MAIDTPTDGAMAGVMIIDHYLSCTHAHKLPLRQERMQLHLVCDRLDAGIVKKLLNLLHAEV